MAALKEMCDGEENPLSDPNLALRTLSNLIKTGEDQKKAYGVVQRWVERRRKI
jgi:hypothetical protein